MYIPQLSNTVKVVERSIFEAVRKVLVYHGYLPDVTLYVDDAPGLASFQADMVTIKTNKGFCIELFGASSSQKKYALKVPRMVIIPTANLPGALGGDYNRIYREYIRNNQRYFESSIQQSMSFDYNFEIHLVGNTMDQMRIMQSVLGIALPALGFIDIWSMPGRISIENMSVRNYPILIEGIMENTYSYRIPDLYEVERTILARNILPIQEISVEFQDNPDPDSDPLTDLTVTT